MSPWSAEDARGLLKAAIRDDNPGESPALLILGYMSPSAQRGSPYMSSEVHPTRVSQLRGSPYMSQSAQRFTLHESVSAEGRPT